MPEYPRSPFEKNGSIISPKVTGDELDMEEAYALRLQNIPDLAAKGAGYWLDGVDDKIGVSVGTDLVVGTGDWSILTEFKNIGNDGAINQIYDVAGAGSIRLILRISATGELYLYFHDGSASDTITGVTDVGADDKNHTAVVTLDRDGNGVIYLDGKVDKTEDITNAQGSLDFTGTANIGIDNDNTSSPFMGDFKRQLHFNLKLTAAEAKALSSGAPVPYKWIGASQTDLIEQNSAGSGTDWTGATGTTPPTGWAKGGTVTDFTIDAASGSGAEPALKITAGSANANINLVGVTEVGKRYRLEFIYKNTAGDVAAYQLGGSLVNLPDSTSWSSVQSIEFTSDSTTNVYLIAKNNGDIIWFDTVSLVQIGCVLQLEGDSVMNGQWLNKNPNLPLVSGTVNGPIATNLPSAHTEEFIQLTAMTDDTEWLSVVPAGYILNFIVFEGENANDATLDLGTSSGAEDVFEQVVIPGNDTKTVVINKFFSKTAAQSLYLNDDGAGSWSGASVQATLYMSKLQV